MNNHSQRYIFTYTAGRIQGVTISRLIFLFISRKIHITFNLNVNILISSIFCVLRKMNAFTGIFFGYTRETYMAIKTLFNVAHIKILRSFIESFKALNANFFLSVNHKNRN